MGSSATSDYCAFTKAVEHLGDRWSLLIVRELGQFGPQGFNTLAAGLPGHVSRSVLTEKLRRLEQLGIVARPEAVGRGPYRLTPAGEQLLPALMALREWADHWLPEDPAVAERDPVVILWWLQHRVDPGAVPDRQVALEIGLHTRDSDRFWLLLARDQPPTLCLEDPMLAPERYVHVHTDAAALLPVARGLRSFADAVREGSIGLFGDPALVGAAPSWFHDRPLASTAAGLPAPSPAVAARA